MLGETIERAANNANIEPVVVSMVHSAVATGVAMLSSGIGREIKNSPAGSETGREHFLEGICWRIAFLQYRYATS